MSSQVLAAVIAASVSAFTLIGTLSVQIYGRRATSRELERTFTEQRTRTLNERFSTAAGQLGSDKPPAVRLAGVYAMAVLADDWEENRQTCVEVLCGYMRMPYEPDPGEQAPGPERLAFRASREVRYTVIRVITAHLREGAGVSWQGLEFDFTGVVFDGGDFGGAEFSGGKVYFDGAEFSGGRVFFNKARFSGGEVSFYRAEFSGSRVFFTEAEFAGGTVSFNEAKFSRGELNFLRARFSRGEVRFLRARFSGGEVGFRFARFSGGKVDFTDPGDWSVPPEFPWTGMPPAGVVLSKEEGQSQV